MRANFPEARVTIVRPFSRVGVDYAGPFKVREYKLRNARLTVQRLLIAVSRRGLLTEIYPEFFGSFPDSE